MSTISNTTISNTRVIQTFRIRPAGVQNENETQTKVSKNKAKERGASSTDDVTRDVNVIFSYHSVAKGSRISGRHGG